MMHLSTWTWGGQRLCETRVVTVDNSEEGWGSVWLWRGTSAKEYCAVCEAISSERFWSRTTNHDRAQLVLYKASERFNFPFTEEAR